MSQPIHCLNCYVFSLGQRKAKVLVAGSDWSERSALAHSLEARGYNVLLARSARQAAELMRLQSPDLVLMDLGLEDLGEKGVQDAVRSLGWDTQLVAWCSPGEPAAPGRLAGIGARDYVLRPLDLPVVEQLIDRRVAAALARGSRQEWIAPAPRLEPSAEKAAAPVPEQDNAPPPVPEPQRPEDPPSPAPPPAEPARAGEGARLWEAFDPLELLLEELKRTIN